ncbi:hypothetical protein ACFOYW_16640 [Gryllotalpicola reticulitermitis]|uniref:Uncharacterized protein n=1 Tax=Gryllotalpicola reticulitermitis TaxID=1184153 RepID=A0ABV8QBF5_9MICO
MSERVLRAIQEVTSRSLPRIPDLMEPGATFAWEDPQATRGHFLAWRDRVAARSLQEVQLLASGGIDPVPGVETERNVVAVALLRGELWQEQIRNRASAPRVEAFLESLNPGVHVRDPLEAGAGFEGAAADAQGDLPPGVYQGTRLDGGGPVRVVVAPLPADVWSTGSAAFALDDQSQTVVAAVTQMTLGRRSGTPGSRLAAVERQLQAGGYTVQDGHLVAPARAPAAPEQVRDPGTAPLSWPGRDSMAAAAPAMGR